MKPDYRDPIVHIAMGAPLDVRIWEGTDRVAGTISRTFAGDPAGRDAARRFILAAWQRPETIKVVVLGKVIDGVQLVPVTATCTPDGAVQLRMLDAA